MKGEVITSSVRIDRLRSRIIEGNIKIPPFQRSFVWKQEQIIELLDSIYNDYPIGSILLWETNDNLPSKRNIGGYSLPESRDDYPINYILDGQQRVTSIFGVFCFDLEQESDPELSTDIFDIDFDLEKKIFIGSKDNTNKNNSIPLKLIFNNYKFNKYLSDNKFSEDLTEESVQLQSVFQNYELPQVSIKKRSKSEVGVIFERVNNSGTPLSTLDLMIAWTWMEEFHLKERFEDIYEILEQKNFGNIKNKIILQSISAIIQETTKTKEILDLNPDSVRENMDLLRNSLEKAIDFISTQFNCESEDFLPRLQQIVPLSFLFSKSNGLDASQSSAVQKWFWRTSFSERYAGSTDQKMDADIMFMKSVLNNDYSVLDKYSSEINETILNKLELSKSSSYCRSFLLLLSLNKPLDLTNGQNIEIGNSLSKYNRKEYHHVFPRAFLKNQGKTNKEINNVLNFCFLPANSNKLISDKSPSDYFARIIPVDNKIQILNSNMLPTESDIYNNNDYELFKQKRTELILQRIRQLTGE